MKTILVDTVNTFVIIGQGINQAMFDLLESYPNRKVILTGADDKQFEEFGLNDLPYEIFSLKHNPEKSDPEYYKLMLRHFNLKTDDVIYFEHNEIAVNAAKQLGLATFHYDKERQDLVGLKKFIEMGLENKKKRE